MTDPHVQRHLLHVAAALRRESPPDLPLEVARRRRRLLDQLERYARRGRFPRPDGPVRPGRRRIAPPRAFTGPGARAPIFEDRAGTRCAVGHLLGLERPDLVAAVRDRDNGVFLPELASPELDAWAARNGFTRDELAWIQPSYCWEVPECTDEFEVSAPAPVAQACEGPDARLVGSTWAGSMSCQVCDGPLQAWVWVQNAGTEPATDVTVTLGADADVLDTVVLPELAAGELVQVGPLLAPDVAAVNHRGWVRVELEGGCLTTPSQAVPWGDTYSHYAPGFVEPEACGGGCPDYTWGADTSGTGDTGATTVPTTPTTGGTTGGSTDGGAADSGTESLSKAGCGCGSGAGPVGAGPAGLVALLLRSRRRTRAVHRRAGGLGDAEPEETGPRTG